MHIWVITEHWPPRVGGIERYLTGIAKYLAKNGHTVTVFAPTPSNSLFVRGRERRRIPLLTKEGLGEVSIVRHRFFYPLIPKWLPLYIFLLLQAFRKKPDVIIAGKALFEGRLASWLKKTLHIPYIVCTYGMEIATWQLEQKTSNQLVGVLAGATHILAINQQTKQELITLGAHAKQITIIYPGIEPANFDQMNNPDDVLKKYAITQPYILSVARLVRRKGIDDLIEAVAQLRIARQDGGPALVLVGDGPERKNLENLAAQSHVPAIFLGTIPDADVHALYSRAKLFALTPKELPGDYEGFGIVYLEAGFFGLPVIATRTGGVPEAVIDNETGILAEPGNSASIAHALTTLLDNPELATHYGEAGKQRVLKQFQWSALISSLEHILATL
ncbi:MAG: hypothetical protein A3E36_00435 [Candidatus Andersenbacteria bacterium RIFCSPHIGHO2_12_FULL_45_11b]|uniref:Glycosyltransferase subfamily 4-like N-terminal domain-containing protein n=1 Tax=Candidatus Andersenbacteria bacterium RIFCSPHIGHO2_12_FULL_45_11b TaxID=1797282 RepID=A0A1G1XAS0_9BACT|nr:MAG: hypothetical protein A3E36_00435 [Candidatus Andersenbacteria bacterium RIFCSPHIGHO2_12_FULL_45_11b]